MSQNSPPPPSKPSVQVERIGEILKRVRERRSDNLQFIAEYLCIRRGFLEALESGQYDKFPADAYVIGFLRSYAEYLGFDGKEAIDLYRAEMAGRRKKPALSMPTPIPEGRAPSVFVMIGALVAAIIVYAMWYGLSTSERAVVSTPPPLPSASAVTESVSPSPASSAVAPAEPAAPTTITAAVTPSQPAAASAPVPETKPAPPAAETKPASVAQAAAQETPAPAKPAHLVIRADQSSWILIVDNKGTTVFDRVLKPGETYQVPDNKPGLSLTTGNAGGIVLTLDGNDLPKIAPTSAGIVRNIPLDSPRLRVLAPPGG